MIDEKRLITDIEINLVCVGDEQVKRHVNEAKNVIIKIIKHQPKVNEWIPVDERLPKDGDYLCSFDDGFITRVSFVDGDWELWAESGEVIAWQPLPNPYVKEK